MNKFQYDTIALMNMCGSICYGDCTDLKSAKSKLNELRKEGKLLALNHAVLIYYYYNCHLEKIQITKYINNTWVIE